MSDGSEERSAGAADKGLERKIKRFVYGTPHRARVIPAPGFLNETESELVGLLSTRLSPESGQPTVRREGSTLAVEGAGYRTLTELTMRLLTAQDLRLELYRGEAFGRGGLKKALAGVPFELYIPRGAVCRLKVESTRSLLYHEGLVAELADGFLTGAGYTVERRGTEESSVSGGERGSGPAVFFLHLMLENNVLSVELSLAGEPLYRRGYRVSLSAAAPLREDLAQAAIRSATAFVSGESGGRPFDTLLVPFAGTGTFLFESLMDLWELPPHIFGREFAFTRLVCRREEGYRWLERKLVERVVSRMAGPAGAAGTDLQLDAAGTSAQPGAADLDGQSEPPGTDARPGSFGSDARHLPAAVLTDISESALESARANAGRFFGSIRQAIPDSRFGADDVRFLKSDAAALPWTGLVPERPGTVFVPLNPPFGKRLRESAGIYAALGRRLSELSEHLSRLGGSLYGCILSPDEARWKAFLRAAGRFETRTVHFSHGGLDIRLTLFR